MEGLEYYHQLMGGNGFAFDVRWAEGPGKHCVAIQDVEQGEELIIEAPLVVWPHTADALATAKPFCEACFADSDTGSHADCSPRWQPFFTPASIRAAREWQDRTDPTCKVTLEALGRSVARVLGTADMLLQRGIPTEQAFVSGALPFYRLCAPAGQLGDWADAYRAALPQLVSLPEGASEALTGVRDQALGDVFLNHLIGGIALNAHSVSLPGGRSGSGVYVLTATLNHSCEPSACVENPPGTVDVSVKALRPMSAGEEVTISYVPEGLSRGERQERLKKYEFTCTCRLCSA